MTPFEIMRGDAPVLLAFPHSSTWLPAGMDKRLNATGRLLADTDWHVDRLYRGLLDGATTVKACFSRYLIDANRDPSGDSLYPGQNTTGLCPVTDFDGNRIYLKGAEPDRTEIVSRLASYHRAYHQALAAEIERLRGLHGAVILYDCHSIRSHIPFLFEGALPDLNIGTNDGRSCSAGIEDLTADICASAGGYRYVVNGRFKGGWTTRHYGNPRGGVHAIQMELAQSTHLGSEVPPFAYDEAKSARLREILREILEGLARLARSGVLDRE